MAQTSLKVFGRQMLRLQNSRVHIEGSEKLCSTSSVRPEILQLLCTFFSFLLSSLQYFKHINYRI